VAEKSKTAAVNISNHQDAPEPRCASSTQRRRRAGAPSAYCRNLSCPCFKDIAPLQMAMHVRFSRSSFWRASAHGCSCRFSSS
jgi:hypothetical protein